VSDASTTTVLEETTTAAAATAAPATAAATTAAPTTQGSSAVTTKAAGATTTKAAAVTATKATTTTAAATTTTAPINTTSAATSVSTSPTTSVTTTIDPAACTAGLLPVKNGIGPARAGCRYRFDFGKSATQTDLAVTLAVPLSGESWRVNFGYDYYGGVAGGFFLGPEEVGLYADALWRLNVPTSPLAARPTYQPMVTDMLGYVAGLPGVTLTPPKPITVGGLNGQVVSYTVGTLPAAASQTECFGATKRPCFPLVGLGGFGSTDLHEGDDGEMALLDTPRGQILLIWWSPASFSGATRTALAASMRDMKMG
jgi:hypothetical protein